VCVLQNWDVWGTELDMVMHDLHTNDVRPSYLLYFVLHVHDHKSKADTIRKQQLKRIQMGRSS